MRPGQWPTPPRVAKQDDNNDVRLAASERSQSGSGSGVRNTLARTFALMCA